MAIPNLDKLVEFCVHAMYTPQVEITTGPQLVHPKQLNLALHSA